MKTNNMKKIDNMVRLPLSGLLLRGALSLGLLFLFMTGCKKDKPLEKYDYTHFTVEFHSQVPAYTASYDSLLVGTPTNIQTFLTADSTLINQATFSDQISMFEEESMADSSHEFGIYVNIVDNIRGHIKITWGKTVIEKDIDCDFEGIFCTGTSLYLMDQDSSNIKVTKYDKP